MNPTRDLLIDPMWRPEDLGAPLPPLPHAVSMCLPTWRDVVGYEERDAEVVSRLACGYPRFVMHPLTAALCREMEQAFAREGERALVFPSLAAAQRAGEHARRRSGAACRLEICGWGGLAALLAEPPGHEAAWKAWQHGGEIVSSRQAEAALAGAPLSTEAEAAGEAARREVRARLARLAGQEPGDVFLFSSGMAAIAALHRAAVALRPGLPTAQVEFPYVDALKAQQHFNPAGAIDISLAPRGGAAEVAEHLGSGSGLAAVFTEAPSNPLLRTADLAGLRALLEPRGIPLFVDDTVATAANVDALSRADATSTSLTKLFSGAGDVMAGAVTLRGSSPLRERLRGPLAAAEADSPLFSLDAIALEKNSRDFLQRFPAVNASGEEVHAFLSSHPRVERLWYPKTETPARYQALMRPGGGYGGLMSVLVKDAIRRAPAFFDALRVSKGPSLGTNFTLACPYTLLAHYGELPWAAERGVEAGLVRLWTGMEPPGEIIRRLEAALEA